MRLRKRGAMIAAGSRVNRGARPGKLDAELGLIAATRRNGNHRPVAGRSAIAGISHGRGAGVPANPAVMLLQPRRRRINLKPILLLAGAVAVAAAMAFAGITLLQQPALAEGQMLYFDGRPICIVQDKQVAEDAVGKIEEDLKGAYGMDVQCSGELTFAPVDCDGQNIAGPQQVEQALKANIDAKVVASVILVNERPAVALKSQGEAQQVLDAVLAPFKAPDGQARTDLAFVENVKIEQMPVDYSLVQSGEDAERTLTLGSGVQDNFYTVEKGDSLARIAKKFTMKISDLRKANPKLTANSVIQPGDTLNAVKPANWVNVRYTETVTRQEALPYETVEQPDATLYTTQKKTQQEGRNGTREVVAQVTFINGMEALKQILSQTVIEAAQNKIVLRGTKKVPTNSGGSGGATVSNGKFIKPLRSYTITSTFKKRTLDGVTRWHYGYDMAAPTGTPIYATAAGTVSYSGSASGYGLVIYLDNGGGIQSRYGHCSKLLVKKGQKVSQGQIIALVGSTGHSTGPHCHFEIRVNGTPVDPTKYVKLR